MWRLALVAVATLNLLSCLPAQEQAENPPLPEVNRVSTIEEFNNLPEEQQKAYPAFEMFQLGAEHDETGIPVEAAIATTELCLTQLKYYLHLPMGEERKELPDAISAFQSDLGEEPTGTLTVGQLQVLSERADAHMPETVHPSGGVFVSGFGGYAVAEGTWSFDDNLIPIQTSKIECYREWRVCLEALAQINYEPFSIFEFSTLPPQLEVLLQRWQITSWTTTEITAKLDDAACVTYNLTIDLRTESAHQVRRGKGGKACEGIAETPQIINLVDGFDAGNKYASERQEKASKYLSSKYVKALMAIAERKNQDQQKLSPTSPP